MIYKRRRNQSKPGAKAAEQLASDDMFDSAFAPGMRTGPDVKKPSVQETAAAKHPGLKKKEWLQLSRQLSTSSTTDRFRRSSSDPLLEQLDDDIDDDPVEDLSERNFTQIPEESPTPSYPIQNGAVGKVPSAAEVEASTAANQNRYEMSPYSAPEDMSRNQVVDETYGDDYATVNDDDPQYEIHNPTFVAPAYRQPLNPYGSESKTDHTLDRDLLNDSVYHHLSDSQYQHLSDSQRSRHPPVYAASPSYDLRRDNFTYAAPEYGEVDYSAPTQADTYDQPMAPTPGAGVPKSALAYRVLPPTQAATAGAGLLPGEEEYAAVNYSEPTQLDQEEYAIVDYCEVDQVKMTAVPKVASSSAAPPSDYEYATVDAILANPSAPPLLPRTQPLPLSTANISSSTPPLATKRRADVYDNGEANAALPPVDDSMYATAEAMTDPSAGPAMPSQGVYRALPARPGAIVSASSGQYAVRIRPVSGPVEGDGAGTVIYSSSPAVGDDVYATADGTMDPTGDIYSVPNNKAKPAAALSAGALSRLTSYQEAVYDNGEANSSQDIYAEVEVMTRTDGTHGVTSSVLPSADTSVYVTCGRGPALPPKANGIYATAEAMTEDKVAAPNTLSPYGFRRVSDGMNPAASSTGPAPASATLVGDKKPTYETTRIRANGAPTTGTVSYEPISSQRSSMPPLDVPLTEQQPGNGEANSALPPQDDSIYATCEAMPEASAGRPNSEANSALPSQDDGIYATPDVYVVRVASNI